MLVAAARHGAAGAAAIGATARGSRRSSRRQSPVPPRRSLGAGAGAVAGRRGRRLLGRVIVVASVLKADRRHLSRLAQAALGESRSGREAARPWRVISPNSKPSWSVTPILEETGAVCPSHLRGRERPAGVARGRRAAKSLRLHCQVCYRPPSRRKLTPKNAQKTRSSQAEPSARQTLTDATAIRRTRRARDHLEKPALMHHKHASDRKLCFNGKVCHGTVSELPSIVVIQVCFRDRGRKPPCELFRR